jgi:hypothetical protein
MPRVGVGQAPEAPAKPRGARGNRAGGAYRTDGAYRVDGTAALRAEPARARAPRLRVAPPLPVTVARTPFVVLVLVLVIGGVLGILMLNTKINENAFRLADLQQQANTLDQREQQLDRELAELSSAGNLEAAVKKLGLVPADTPAHLRLPDGRVFGVPQPASGQPSVTSQTAAGGR